MKRAGALRGSRQGEEQSSVSKTDDIADCMTQEQGSVEGRTELKAKADKLFLHSFIFTFFYFA